VGYVWVGVRGGPSRGGINQYLVAGAG
jgi:hypothetical protein